MLDSLTNSLDFQTQALVLRAERQRVIAGNIANADTPGYAARSLDFNAALREATGGSPLAQSAGSASDGRTDARHIPLAANGGGGGGGVSTTALGYTVQTQPSLDNNSVDLDRERAAFVDNAVRYEATLRFINGQSKTLLSAIQGQ